MFVCEGMQKRESCPAHPKKCGRPGTPREFAARHILPEIIKMIPSLVDALVGFPPGSAMDVVAIPGLPPWLIETPALQHLPLPLNSSRQNSDPCSPIAGMLVVTCKSFVREEWLAAVVRVRRIDYTPRHFNLMTKIILADPRDSRSVPASACSAEKLKNPVHPS
jgi:hypothetical protein